MFKNVSLRTKLLAFGALSIVSQAIVLAMLFKANAEISDVAARECLALSSSDLNHILQGTYATCSTQHQSAQQILEGALKVGRKAIADQGGLHFDPSSKVVWNAVNQFSRQSESVTLPRVLIGKTWLGQNFDLSQPTAIVDDVKLAGAHCTIFQRKNEAGEMLRVATTHETADHKRAIGTFLPRIEPDGKSNTVTEYIMRGETYRGRAFVVIEWFLTVYEPIYGKDRNLVGILYVGIKQQNVPGLREAIVKTKVSKSGQSLVLDSKGRIVMAEGVTDGSDAAAAATVLDLAVRQEIAVKAATLATGAIGEHRYTARDAGKATARTQIARFMHFEPWDWVLVVTTPEEELLEGQQAVESVGRRTLIVMLAVSLSIALIVLVLSILLARSITRPIAEVVQVLDKIATGDFNQRLEITGEGEIGRMAGALRRLLVNLRGSISDIAQTAQTLASSSHELTAVSQQMASNAEETAAQAGVAATAAEQVSSNITTVASAGEEMGASIREIAKSANEAARVATSAVKVAQRTNATMAKLDDSSAEIGNVIKVITSIAQQTNLLALNATVEAARAGEAGKGFAVVANAVKELAKQTAKATEDISRKIETIQGDTKEAVGAIEQIGKIIDTINDLQNTIASAVEEQTATTGEISRNVTEAAKGSNEITQNITGVAQAARSTTEGASNTRSAADELAKVAANLQTLVAKFKY